MLCLLFKLKVFKEIGRYAADIELVKNWSILSQFSLKNVLAKNVNLLLLYLLKEIWGIKPTVVKSLVQISATISF